jgi:hypothetical protein
VVNCLATEKFLSTHRETLSHVIRCILCLKEIVVTGRFYRTIYFYIVDLGGLVVSVLATGPTGSIPTEVDGFLRVIKIWSTTSFGWEVKPSVPCRRFTACKRTLRAWIELVMLVSKIQRPFDCQMALVATSGLSRWWVGWSLTATNAQDQVTSERGGQCPYRAVEPWLLYYYISILRHSLYVPIYLSLWYRVQHVNLIVAKMVKKLSTFYGTGIFITMYKRALELCSPFHTLTSHLFEIILILSSHLYVSHKRFLQLSLQN